MAASPLLNQLMTALRCLPGVGPKSAQRMALHVLERNRDGGQRLAAALQAALEGIGHCRSCRDLSETEFCPVCANPHRDRSLLCVIETPADVLAVEQATGFQGVYFVLMGHLSPLDGLARRNWAWRRWRRDWLKGKSARSFLPPIQLWKVRRPRIISLNWRVSMRSAPRASPTECRWAENWIQWMVALWRMLLRGGGTGERPLGNLEIRVHAVNADFAHPSVRF
jgi:hypothetical protein